MTRLSQDTASSYGSKTNGGRGGFVPRSCFPRRRPLRLIEAPRPSRAKAGIDQPTFDRLASQSPNLLGRKFACDCSDNRSVRAPEASDLGMSLGPEKKFRTDASSRTRP